LPAKVLEYSIRKHASMSVRVFPLHEVELEVPQPRDESNRPRSPFSFHRFLIPELADRRGRAIYLDSDMLVFSDLRRLWNQPFDGADVLAVGASSIAEKRAQFGVMLLDCESLDWNIAAIVEALDAGDLSYEELMFEMKAARHVSAVIDSSWNSLERHKKGRTALLHYTDMERQPWVSRNNPLSKLWMTELIEAIDVGHISLTDVEEQVRRGNVRPSLLYQVNNRVMDSRYLSRKARDLDAGFIPPAIPAPSQATVVGRSFQGRVKRLLGRLTYGDPNEVGNTVRRR
jgi:hypothetical protein